PSPRGTSGSASAWTRSSARRPREHSAPGARVPGRRARLPVPLHARRAVPGRLQVPPVVLAVRDRRAARARARQGRDPRRLAAPALQPVEPRRRRLRTRPEALQVIPLILGSPLTPLENLLRNVLEWFHGTIGLPWAWAIVAV